MVTAASEQTCCTTPKAGVARAPSSMADASKAAPSSTATLRRSEENSSAKIFINDVPQRFTRRLHLDLFPPCSSRGGEPDPVQIAPALRPFDDGNSVMMQKLI